MGCSPLEFFMGLTFVEYLQHAAKYYCNNNQRIGQAYFNAALILDEDLVEFDIYGSFIDCFVNDDNLPAFLVYIKSRLS